MQGDVGRTAKKTEKRRSPWDKEGKFRYLHKKLDQIRKEVREGFKRQDAQFRILFNTLSPFLAEIDKDYIMSTVCRDEADEALLAYLHSKGDQGITPTEACAAKELARFRFKPFNITRRIQRMNKRLKDELGKSVAEKHGRRWVMTSFAHRAWGATKEEISESFDVERRK